MEVMYVLLGLFELLRELIMKVSCPLVVIRKKSRAILKKFELSEDLANIKATFSINLVELQCKEKCNFTLDGLLLHLLFQLALHDYVIDGEGNIYPCNAEFNIIGKKLDLQFDIKEKYFYKEL